MRPEILFPLFAPVTTLPGVGPRIGGLIEKAVGGRVIDLLWHLPTGLIDRSLRPTIAGAQEGTVATFEVEVAAHLAPRHNRQPYKVRCTDPTGSLMLVFFRARADYLEKVLPEGTTRIVSGTVERFGDDLQMTHPDHIVAPEDQDELPAIEPVYPKTAGLTPRPLAKAVNAALARAPTTPEWIDSAYLKKQDWPAWHEAVNAVHAPNAAADLEPNASARQRLAYDELFANQLALGLIRHHMRRTSGRRVRGDGRLVDAVIRQLPYQLTDGQKHAIEDIRTDMESPDRMLRLLQGDVGSGKTVVALLAMLAAVEAGHQSAFMAPTGLLAQQHFETITELTANIDIRCALLTGRDKGSARDALLSDLETGRIDILIGTHAVFQQGVAFNDLAFAVIDEQHKFGVHQRLGLQDKGAAVDLLVMTATPIPRTLMLTAYGDMDVSRLTERPAGRQPIKTTTAPLSRLDEAIAAVGRVIDRGEQVYWVCPLVTESEVSDLAAAEERFAALDQQFPGKIGLVHGRMNDEVRDRTMTAFQNGTIRVLVATTVIEVGIDVSAATIMVIEHAERFGLAQLHQLRGRVGRGSVRSHCLLLYAAPLGTTARARLNIMRDTDDGFLIAEEDLRLRGAGELLGTRQSGLPDLRLADMAAHAELLVAAHDDAALVLARDPELSDARGQALRTLLYLFERDAAVSYLRSG